MGFAENDIGIGNRLTLLDDELPENLHAIQLLNGLPPSASLASGDFTLEMETGTGKTYVYLRTVFELNKRYGFNKFVIVVPSVAIKEGVYKSLQIMEEHFRSLYANVPFEYFLYDSSKLGQVRNFATSANIQVMVVTVSAINKKDVNNLYKDSEKTGGEKSIDLIKATRPIIIVDEPQSVDGGLEGRGKEALGTMNPLCALRFSATHVEKLPHGLAERAVIGTRATGRCFTLQRVSEYANRSDPPTALRASHIKHFYFLHSEFELLPAESVSSA